MKELMIYLVNISTTSIPYYRFGYNFVITLALGGIAVDFSAEKTSPFSLLPAYQSVRFI